MGRFYNGDIEGKFWFGVQDSDDVENLVTVNAYVYYSWKICNCVAEIDAYNYCNQCYDSISEHIEAAVKDEEYEDEHLYYEEITQGYSLDKETHYDELKKNMEDLRKKIPEEIIQEFDKIEQTDKILDAFTGVFDNISKVVSNYFGGLPQLGDENRMLVKIVARYTLGYQIEYCLRTTDDCNINCEY